MAWVQIYGGEPVGGGPGSQSLTPTLFANTNSFGTPTVTRGAVTLSPTLVADGDSFGSHTVTRGAVTLSPTAFTDGDSFGSPTVTRGAVTLSPTRYTNSSTFGTAVVTRGAVTLTATLYNDSDSFGAHTVANGSAPTQTLYPTLLFDATVGLRWGADDLYWSASGLAWGSGDTFGAHSVTTLTTLSPTLFADSDSFGTPVVTRGAVTLTPTLFVDADSFGSHVVAGGDAPTPSEPTDKERGPGGVRPRRRYWRVYDGERWVEVHSQDALQAIVAEVEAREATKAKEVAAQLAQRQRVRTRAAVRKAPEVRVEATEASDELQAVQANVAAVNERLREMYAQALQVELIGKLLRQRLEEDDEDEALALLLD